MSTLPRRRTNAPKASKERASELAKAAILVFLFAFVVWSLT